MTYSFERELRGPLTAWLRARGLRVVPEVPILERRADIVGLSRDLVVALEMKLRDWPGALRQAVAYQLASDEVWIAMPLASAARAHRHRWRFESEGIGLLAVDDRGTVRCAVRAGPSPRLLPFAQELLRVRLASESLVDASLFSKRETDLEPF